MICLPLSEQSASTMISCDFARRHITISEKSLPLCGFQAISGLSTKRVWLQKQKKNGCLDGGLSGFGIKQEASRNSQNFLSAEPFKNVQHFRYANVNVQ